MTWAHAVSPYSIFSSHQNAPSPPFEVLFVKLYWCFLFQSVCFFDWVNVKEEHTCVCHLCSHSALLCHCLTSNAQVWRFPTEQTVLKHQPRVLQFNSILTSPTWRQAWIPHIKGSVPQDCCPPPYTHTHTHTPVNAGSAGGRALPCKSAAMLFLLLSLHTMRTRGWECSSQEVIVGYLRTKADGLRMAGQEGREWAWLPDSCLDHCTGSGLRCLSVLVWDTNEILFV